MKNILITGCNRGIGLALVKNFLKQKSVHNIIATCRQPDNATDLNTLSQEHSNLHILQLDVKDFGRYDSLAKDVTDIVKHEGLNVLINNAAISAKFTRVNLVKAEQMTEHFLVNATAPLMLTKALLPLLKQASTVNSSAPIGLNRAAVINMSSILGSIAENQQQGGFYPYRSSKSALNSITRSLSLDLKDDNILVTCLHPGWIKTDMGGSKAPLEVEPAVESIVNTLMSFTGIHNGNYYQYDGKELRW